jgi:carbamoyltransferase
MGAAMQFALANGARPGPPMRHAYLCGPEYSAGEIRQALRASPENGHIELGNVSSPEDQERIAHLLARLVSRDLVVGLFQGIAETGPRALGHRSILANPRNPRMLAILNERVKFREPFRPLAPMLTPGAAERLYHLSPGASDDGYNAYGYMVLTARARPGTQERVPAVVHEDGTSRLQIVRRDVSPFTHAFLVAMGRRNGEEVSVNTSLNVGSPIAQTPEQAIKTLNRSLGMDGLLMIAADGRAFLSWQAGQNARKNGRGQLLHTALTTWRTATESKAAPPLTSA